MASRPKENGNPMDLQEILNPKSKLSSASTFLHVLYLNKWRILLIWLLLAVPAGTFLALWDVPQKHEVTTYLRFPRVIGASQQTMVRDVSITERESIVRLFLSHNVLNKTVQEMGLQVRLLTKNLYKQGTFEAAEFSPEAKSGLYFYTFGEGRNVKVTLKADGEDEKRKIFEGQVDPNGWVSAGGMRIRFKESFVAVAKDMDLEFRLTGLEHVVAQFAEKLTVTPLDKGAVTVNYAVTLADHDPYLAPEILNRLTENFLEVYSGTTEVQDVGVLAQMEKNLDQGKQNLKKAQDRLADFFNRHPNAMQTRTENNNFALMQAQTQKMQLEGHLDRLTMSLTNKPSSADGPEEKRLWMEEVLGTLSGQGVSRAEALRQKLAQTDARIKELEAQYSSTHPFFQEAAEEGARLFPQVVRLAEDTRANYRSRIGQAEGNIYRNLPGGGSMAVELEAKRLTEEKDNLSKTVDNLQAELDKAKLTAGQELFKVNIIDKARPPLFEPPSLKRRLMFAAVAVLFCFFPALLWVVASQILFPRVWNKDDAERKLKVKVLGSIFHMGRAPRALRNAPRRQKLEERLLHIGSAPGLTDLEAYRAVRAEIESYYAPEGLEIGPVPRLRLLITSTQPNEGKSLFSANISLAFAKRGAKTLLIDTDFRHGMQEKMFGLEPKYGLTDILARTDLSEGAFQELCAGSVLATPLEGLHLLPKGTYYEGVEEVMANGKIDHLIAWASQWYDVILIDTAPVIVTADPLNMMHLADGVVFVIRSGQASVSEVTRALEPVKEREPRLGVVVNAIRRSPVDENFFAKYSYYYHSAASKSIPKAPAATSPVAARGGSPMGSSPRRGAGDWAPGSSAPQPGSSPMRPAAPAHPTAPASTPFRAAAAPGSTPASAAEPTDSWAAQASASRNATPLRASDSAIQAAFGTASGSSLFRSNPGPSPFDSQINSELQAFRARARQQEVDGHERNGLNGNGVNGFGGEGEGLKPPIPIIKKAGKGPQGFNPLPPI